MAEQQFNAEELATEEWRPVIGFERYEVSNLGRIRRATAGYHTRIGRILSPFPDKRGYLRVNMRNGDGRPYMRFVHRLVALAFLPKESDRPHVNHKDGNKANNRLSNLEHLTPQENMTHAALHGLTAKHERSARARLTRQQVREIRGSQESVATLMRKYSTSETQIRRLRNGEQWAGI